ncbi:MAG: extracellular solute-binding protein [Rhodospirillales bacterium]
MTKHIFRLKALLAGAACAVLAAHPAAAEEEVKITHWAEYMAEETLSNFEEEFGIKVTFDAYDSVEAIDSKLLAGNSGYDVVSHSASQIARLIPAGGIIQPLDRSKLDNFKHMQPEVMNKLADKWDPGNQYIAPFMWGTHGVTYNRALVLKTYPDAPIGLLEMVLEPKHMKELAKCGVAFMDSPTDVLPMALAHLGLPPDTNNPAHYNQAKELLAKVRPYIKTFDNYAYQRMPEREFCVAVTWGPDGLLAMSGAVEANTGVELNFYLPQGEGAANFWVDGWIIPADAKNVENAHKLINYLMRPEVGAADSNYTWYATANKTGLPMVDEEVRTSPASYPTPEQVSLMYTLAPLTPKGERARTRAWTDVKAGK